MIENTITPTAAPVDRDSSILTKEPAKGEGVPREARGGSFVPELERALTGLVTPAAIREAAEVRGFYDTGLLQQWRMLADIAVELAGPESISALEAADDTRVRGIAPMAVRLVHLQDLPTATTFLRRQAALPGTSVQEGAQMVLKLVFLEHGLEPTLALVREWATDPIAEVRRCLVEALRPRGVWTAHLPELRRDPRPLATILELVLDDPSLYVRKAVANCLNDIGKDNPEILLQWVGRWTGSGGPGREWALARGLRSLAKAGNPEALRLLGLAGAETFTARWRNQLPEQVHLNQQLPIEVEVANNGGEPARVLVQGTLSGPGRGKSPRVRRYRIGAAELPAGANAIVAGRIHFVDFNSQPKLAGTYELTLDLNGRIIETRTFIYAPKPAE